MPAGRLPPGRRNCELCGKDMAGEHSRAKAHSACRKAEADGPKGARSPRGKFLAPFSAERRQDLKEVLAALEHLGFKPKEALAELKALPARMQATAPAEEMIEAALKASGRGRAPARAGGKAGPHPAPAGEADVAPPAGPVAPAPPPAAETSDPGPATAPARTSGEGKAATLLDRVRALEDRVEDLACGDLRADLDELRRQHEEVGRRLVDFYRRVFGKDPNPPASWRDLVDAS